MLYLIIVNNHGHVCHKEIYRKYPIFTKILLKHWSLNYINSRKNPKNVFTVTSYHAFYAIFYCLSPPQSNYNKEYK